MYARVGPASAVRKALLSSMSSSCKTEKRELRQRIKTALSGLKDEQVFAQSQAAQSTLIGLEQYKRAKRLSIYLSMPTGELQTDLLIRDALRTGKEVFVPYLSKDPKVVPPQKSQKIMSMLRLASLDEYTGLQRDAWGIPTLPQVGIEDRQNALGGFGVVDNGEKHQGLDLIVVPGVAFDHNMGRLGHGAGFYDSYLTRYSTDVLRQKPFLVGLCLSEQFLLQGALVPTTEHDREVDVVIAGDTGVHQRLQ